MLHPGIESFSPERIGTKTRRKTQPKKAGSNSGWKRCFTFNCYALFWKKLILFPV